jgi:hypothetical protein
VTKNEYHTRAARIADDLIDLSDKEIGPPDRESLRTILRIAFELQLFLASMPGSEEEMEWTQDTVFSGCDSIHLACVTWRRLHRVQELSLPGAGPDTFPLDLTDLRRQLDDALQTAQDKSQPLFTRLRAINRTARLQLLFLGATLW